jgi:hypothetical protein
MDMVEYLRSSHRQPIPEWLKALAPPDVVDKQILRSFFQSGVVFYPGSGFDGHAVKVFGGSHSAHCFVYADYGAQKSEIQRHLEAGNREAFRGYKTFARFELAKEMITPSTFRQHATVEQVEKFRMSLRHPYEIYGFLEILERYAPFTDDHGPERIAVMFLGADGHATYDALFCQDNQVAPFAVLLQDHGFGGNWSVFGKAGVMHDIAQKTDRLPELLLVGVGTEPWEGYTELLDINPSYGGWASFERRLFKRSHS